MQASSVAFCCFLVIQRKYPIFFLVQVFSSHLVTRCEHSGGARGQQQRLGQRHGWHVIWSGRNKKIENAWRQHHEKTTRRQVEHQESVVPEMVKQCLWTLFLLSCSTLSLSSISASAPSDLQACRGTRCPPGCSRWGQNPTVLPIAYRTSPGKSMLQYLLDNDSPCWMPYWTWTFGWKVLAAIKTEGVLDSERKKDTAMKKTLRGIFKCFHTVVTIVTVWAPIVCYFIALQDVEEVLGSISDEYFAELFRSIPPG